MGIPAAKKPVSSIYVYEKNILTVHHINLICFLHQLCVFGKASRKSGISASDPPLTAAGQHSVVDLAKLLKTKKCLSSIPPTPPAQLKTGTLLSDSINTPITLYSPYTTALFVNKLKSLKSNVLVVGHSNTVLELLDSFHLSHNLKNIPDNGFNNLFIIKATRFLQPKDH